VEKYQELEKSLSVEQGVIKENDKVIAKLIDREQASDYGHLVIVDKRNVQNDLNQVSEES